MCALVGVLIKWLTTDIHALGGIRTHNVSRRAAADLRTRHLLVNLKWEMLWNGN